MSQSRLRSNEQYRSIAALCPKKSAVQIDGPLIFGCVFPFEGLMAVSLLNMFREMFESFTQKKSDEDVTAKRSTAQR